MAFCTNCGGKINDDWKHCPSCGQTIALRKSKSPKLPKDFKEEPTSNRAKPANLGIPMDFQKIEKKIAQDKIVSQSNGVKGDRFFLIVGVVILLFSIIIVLGANNGNSKSNFQQVAQVQDAQVDPEVEKLKNERQAFNESIGGFLAAGCKPTITKQKGQAWEDNYVMANMEVTGVRGVSTFPDRYINQSGFSTRGITINDWGNQVDKVLMVSAAYEELLAPLYWEIFGMWTSWNELGKYKSKFNSYLNLADGVAKKFCYQGLQPSESQEKLAEKYLNNLIEKWPDFNSWRGEVWTREGELSDQLESDTTPQCRESKTNLPNYNIITCTNLP